MESMSAEIRVSEGQNGKANKVRTLERPILLDPSKEHNELVWCECSQGGVRKDLREPGSERFHLSLNSAAECKINDLLHVRTNVINSNRDVGAIGHKLNRRIARKREIKTQIFDPDALDLDAVSRVDLLNGS